MIVALGVDRRQQVGAAGVSQPLHSGLDLALIASDRPAAAAGVFTRSTVVGAPVELSRRHLRSPRARVIVANSGCSNVAMGARGRRDARSMAEAAARATGVPPSQVLVASTGVIGEPLPIARVRRGIRGAAAAEQLYDFKSFGNVRLLHFADCHAQLLPIYYREPSVNLGVGPARGHAPHLVGDALLTKFGIASGSARGAIIGAAIGGAAGAAIGGVMDAQAEDLQDKLPNAQVERVGEGIQITFDSGILFDVNQSMLRGAAQQNLTDLAASLEEYEGTDVLVVGHTDSTGEALPKPWSRLPR